MAMIANSDVSVATIRDVLNAAGGSVSNDTTSFFTANAKINPYSKHKPVVLSVNFCQDFDSSRSDYDADWWLGLSQQCGLVAIPLNSVTELPNAYDGNMNGWNYEIPSGGQSKPMRLGDFCGYDTDATPPMYNFKVYDMANSSNADKLAASIYVVPSGSTSISFLDMPIIKNYYFGVYLKKNSSTVYTVNTNTTSISAGINSVNINPYQLSTGTYTAYPFIAEEKQSQSQPSMTNILYALPGVTPLTLRVMSTADQYVVTVTVKTALASRLTLTISITNNTSSSKTFTNNTLRVRTKGTSFDDPLTSDDYDEILGNITVSANSTHTFSHIVMLTGYIELQSGGVVYLSLDSANIVKSDTYTVSDSGGEIT